MHAGILGLRMEGRGGGSEALNDSQLAGRRRKKRMIKLRKKITQINRVPERSDFFPRMIPRHSPTGGGLGCRPFGVGSCSGDWNAPLPERQERGKRKQTFGVKNGNFPKTKENEY